MSDTDQNLDLGFLKTHKYMEGFAIYGTLIAIRYSHTIFVYRDASTYIHLKKQERTRSEVKYVNESGSGDPSFPIAMFQANEAGWNYALGFIRQFGGDGLKLIFIKV